jgi:hypothetical protein
LLLILKPNKTGILLLPLQAIAEIIRNISVKKWLLERKNGKLKIFSDETVYKTIESRDEIFLN